MSEHVAPFYYGNLYNPFLDECFDESAPLGMFFSRRRRAHA